jgi:hypothetical protein
MIVWRQAEIQNFNGTAPKSALSSAARAAIMLWMSFSLRRQRYLTVCRRKKKGYMFLNIRDIMVRGYCVMKPIFGPAP